MEVGDGGLRMGDERQHALTGADHPWNQTDPQPWQGIPTHVLVHNPDLYAQVTAAHVRNRRRRWAWLGIAGAGITLIAVVVATLFATPWTPSPPEVKAPSMPTEGPVGAAERLRGPVAMVRSGMAGWEDERTVPDPSAALPCPDAASALDLSYTAQDPEPTGINAAGTTLSGCGWSTDRSASNFPQLRIDLTLRAEADLLTDTVVRRLDTVATRDGCDWATLFAGRPFNALMVCETDDKRIWTVVVADDDGTGAWVLTNAVGADLSAAFNTGAQLVAELWGVLWRLPAAEDAAERGTLPRVPPMRREIVELVDALAARPEPLSLGASGDRQCHEATAELANALDVELTQASPPASTPSQPLCWWTVGPVPTNDAEFVETLSFSLGVDGKADHASHRAYVDPGSQGVIGPDGFEAPDTCLSSDSPLAPQRTTVLACSLDGRTTWSVVSASPDGAELWVLSAYVPAGADVDQSTSVLALVDLADRLW
jgi:hypothetical protein